MKKAILIAALLLPLSGWASTALESTTNPSKSGIMSNEEKEEIKKALLSYRDALNESSTSKVLELYTANGVFMPSGAPTAVGTAQVKASYEYVFSQIQLSIEFEIDEIEVVGDYAFARTTSKGSALIHATGETVSEKNRELFVLKNENGNWKIDRYMFNKME
jgi:uncharacterized protein (TIGR02246 family)